MFLFFLFVLDFILLILFGLMCNFMYMDLMNYMNLEYIWLYFDLDGMSYIFIFFYFMDLVWFFGFVLIGLLIMLGYVFNMVML